VRARRWGRALLLAAACLALHGTAVASDCVSELPCARATSWNTAFNAFEISVAGTRPGEYARWRATMSQATNDFRIQVDERRAGTVKRGELAMVAGRTLITRDLNLAPGFETDAIDEPLLAAMLTITLLGRAFPDGPETLRGAHNVKLLDQREGFRIGTPSASAAYAAPWSVTGPVRRDKAGKIHFDLRLVSGRADDPREAQTKARIKGTLEQTGSDLRLRDDMPLAGWKVYGVGPRSTQSGGVTTYDYGATADSKGYRTVGEIRAEIERDLHPGTPDPGKDFSGFWKKDCTQHFGLQIKPDGVPGRYAINFCGPGACGVDDRHSFINGDPHYQVISEDELRERYGDGWSTLHRCSRDPDDTPVGKY